MTVRIAGMGWVTPLGAGLEEVWERLLAGHVAEPKTIQNPETGRMHQYLAAPAKACERLARHPRLRRSSAISLYAASAAFDALADAGVEMTPATAERTAVVFAISSGGVVYTRRFYEQIVKQGPSGASPLLFPETVYNAPASHLAALLGVDGASYTLVGDGAVGLRAVRFAQQLLASGEVDRCIVAGAEEIDWILCEAYGDWRLLTNHPAAAVFPERPRGAILAEGAAALVLAREGGRAEISEIHTGVSFSSRAEAAAAVDRVCGELVAPEAQAVISSANGTFVDELEAQAIARHSPRAEVYAPKASLGEALGAGAIMQLAIGALSLRGRLPSTPRDQSAGPTRLRVTRDPQATLPLESVLVLSTGWNQQACGARLAAVD